MRKVYWDKTAPENACTSVYVKDAEVIAAGTTVYAMSVKEKNAEYQKYAEEYGICFIFDDKLPKIDFYTVPHVDIFATDGDGGLFGTIGGITDLNADIPICYMDQSRTCFWAAENGNAFLAAAGSWRERLSPYEGITFYRSKEEAEQQLEFIEPEPGGKMYLETKNCTIRNFALSDVKELYETLSDREVMEYIEPPFSLEQTAQFIKHIMLSEKPPVFAVEYKETGKVIGHVIYHSYDKNSYELGWILNRKYWGKGIAEELTFSLIEFSKNNGIESLIIECSPKQAVTKHIAQKYHFSYEGMQDDCEIYRLNLIHENETFL